MPDPDTVPSRLARRVADTPDAIAFHYEAAPGQWVPVTWLDFAQRVDCARQGLAAAGLRSGDRLVLIAPVSLEWEVLHHAALALGVVVVGLDAHDLPERIAAMVEQADITAFATASPQVLAKLAPERWARCRLALQLGQPGDAWPGGAEPKRWSQLVELGLHNGAIAAGAPAAEDTATIIFTSGTTGAPKGIAYRHSQLCLAIDAIADAFPFADTGTRLLCWLPLSSLFQRIVNLAGLERGAASYLLGDPRRVMEVVGGVSPDVFIGVPRFYEKLYIGVQDQIRTLPGWQRRAVDWAWQVGRISSPYRQKRQPLPLKLGFAWALADRAVLRPIRAVMGSRLRCMVTGSAPMPAYLLEEFHALGWLVLEAYGLSENVLPMAMNRVDEFRFGTVGRPLQGNQIVVAEDGAIRVSGAGIFHGYLDEQTRTGGDAENFFLTGDLGHLSTDGYLTLTGRTGDLIKTSTGRRIAPAGVEAQLRQVPGIDEAVLIGTGRNYLVALCTSSAPKLDEESRMKLAERISIQISQLGTHERPRGIALLHRPFSIEQGELTPNLKIRHSAVEDKHAALINSIYQKIDGSPATPDGQVIVI